MKVTLMAVGRTQSPLMRRAIDDYLERLRHYLPVDVDIVDDPKFARSATNEARKQAEGSAILRRLQPGDHVALLDENGRELTSRGFAEMMQSRMNSGVKRLVFIVGGPFGFSPEVYDRADSKLSLSKMTFNHEMVRLFFTEQLYRAMTIIRGESYHHD